MNKKKEMEENGGKWRKMEENGGKWTDRGEMSRGCHGQIFGFGLLGDVGQVAVAVGTGRAEAVADEPAGLARLPLALLPPAATAATATATASATAATATAANAAVLRRGDGRQRQRRVAQCGRLAHHRRPTLRPGGDERGAGLVHEGVIVVPDVHQIVAGHTVARWRWRRLALGVQILSLRLGHNARARPSSATYPQHGPN